MDNNEKKETRRLDVVYDGPMDTELDDKITELLESLGWERWASGFNLVDRQRDMAFEIPCA